MVKYVSVYSRRNRYFGYEKDIERWLPTDGINTLMISIISMLSAPNFESPAIIDASKLWRDHPNKYKNEFIKWFLYHNLNY